MLSGSGVCMVIFDPGSRISFPTELGVSVWFMHFHIRVLSAVTHRRVVWMVPYILFNPFINDISDIIDSTSTIKIFADNVKIYTNIEQYYPRFLALSWTCKPVWNTSINCHKYGNCQFLTPNTTWSLILGHADIPQMINLSYLYCYLKISKIYIFVYIGVHFECLEPISQNISKSRGQDKQFNFVHEFCSKLWFIYSRYNVEGP